MGDAYNKNDNRYYLHNIFQKPRVTLSTLHASSHSKDMFRNYHQSHSREKKTEARSSSAHRTFLPRFSGSRGGQSGPFCCARLGLRWEGAQAGAPSHVCFCSVRRHCTTARGPPLLSQTHRDWCPAVCQTGGSLLQASWRQDPEG